MKHKLSVGLMVSVTALFSQSVYSDVHAIVNNGVTCQVMNTTQQGLLEWKATGLVNKSTTTDVWVACPFISTRHDAVDPTVNGALVAISNNGTSSIASTCLYREVYADGVTYKTISRSLTIPGLGYEVFVFDDFTDILPNNTSAATIACLLPRNCQLNAVFQVTEHL